MEPDRDTMENPFKTEEIPAASGKEKVAAKQSVASLDPQVAAAAQALSLAMDITRAEATEMILARQAAAKAAE
jgi:hypothetical protein